MRVGVLGPLAVEVEGRAVDLGGQRLRDLLAVLVQRRGRPVPAEALLDLVWGERVADASPVHTVVARLRRRLGGDAVRRSAAGYLVDAVTDEDDFSALSARAGSATELGDVATAVRLRRAALELWRGPEPWAGVSDELVRADRARLEELRGSVTEELVFLLLDHPELAAGDEALALASWWAGASPLHERAHQLVMLAAYRAGRQADALATYRGLRDRLRRELGVDPAPATSRLHELVLRHDPSLAGPLAGPLADPRAGSLAVRATPTAADRDGPVVPRPLTPTIGRERELAEVRRLLASGCRLVTVVGPGGVGKSRLLAEVGADVGSAAGAGAGTAAGAAAGGGRRPAYLELGGLDVEGAARSSELAEALALRLRVPPGPGSALDALAATLRARPRLLLLDEGEAVAEPLGAVLAQLLERAPATAAVVTSRRPLSVAGEVVLPLSPLAVPEDGAATGELRTAAAVALLVARLAQQGVEVGDDGETARLLAAIVRRLEGLPLAIELVAGRAGSLSLVELAALAADPLDVRAAARPRNPRHGSLRDALRWSTERLTPEQRTVLGRLTVFAGRFDAAAAAAVVGDAGPDVAEVLGSLAREGLLQIERPAAASVEFRLLRTVRDLAAESVVVTERDAAAVRHRRWYAARWRDQPRSDALVADVREHHEDYLAAQRSALAAADRHAVADLALTLSRFWTFARGRQASLRWTTSALDSDALTARERARLQAQRAALALHHDAALVLRDTADAIAALDRSADAPWLVTALVVRAMELKSRGDDAAARAAADRAVDVARGLGVERLADALGVQAVVHAATGSDRVAATAVDEALPLVAAAGSAAARVAVGSNLGFALVELDRSADALTLLEDVVAQARTLLGAEPTYLVQNLGWAALDCGESARAAAAFAGIVGDEGRAHDRMGAETALGLACSLVALGDASGTARLADALAVAAAVGLRLGPGLQRAVERAQRSRPVSAALAPAPPAPRP